MTKQEQECQSDEQFSLREFWKTAKAAAIDTPRQFFEPFTPGYWRSLAGKSDLLRGVSNVVAQAPEKLLDVMHKNTRELMSAAKRTDVTKTVGG